MDAQRSEVFAGEYEMESANPVAARMKREAVCSFERFRSRSGASDPTPKIFTPDTALPLASRKPASLRS